MATFLADFALHLYGGLDLLLICYSFFISTELGLESIWLFFSFFILLFSVLSVTSGNPVFCILFLVLSFFSSSLFLISLGIDFVGLMLMVVYVGAIAVLFLFVIMLLNIKEEFNAPSFLILSLTINLFGFLSSELTFCPLGSLFSYTDWFHIDRLDCLNCIGYILYTDLIVAFIGISVVLIVAMVGAIALNFTAEKGIRNQDILFQCSRSTQTALFIKN
jgi:NADH-quinone oxidoreductase subunit J